MAKQIIISFLIITTLCLTGCFRTDSGFNTELPAASITGNILDFSIALNNEWRLTDVYVNNTNIQFSRENQIEAFKDIYTINFDGQTVSGTGAPNRYSAPYTLGDNQSISIMMMRSTLMASIFEPENLTEHVYYSYVQKSYKWELNDRNLVLHSKTEDGLDVHLVFVK